jgi:hypothetical protein
MCRSAAECNDQTDQDQPHNNEYFDTREPEFKLAKDTNPKVVNDNDKKEEDCNPHTRIDFITINPISTILTRSCQMELTEAPRQQLSIWILLVSDSQNSRTYWLGLYG